MHIGIALTAGILRRIRRGDDGSVHKGARVLEQTLLGEVRVDLFEQRLGEVIGDRQAAKIQQRGGIGNRLARQVDPHEVSQCRTVVDRVLERFNTQAVALLKQVHAQQLRHTHQLLANTTTGRVQRLDDGEQSRSRHQPIHVGETLLAGGLPLFSRRTRCRQSCVGSWSHQGLSRYVPVRMGCACFGELIGAILMWKSC